MINSIRLLSTLVFFSPQDNLEVHEWPLNSSSTWSTYDNSPVKFLFRPSGPHYRTVKLGRFEIPKAPGSKFRLREDPSKPFCSCHTAQSKHIGRCSHIHFFFFTNIVNFVESSCHYFLEKFVDMIL